MKSGIARSAEAKRRRDVGAVRLPIHSSTAYKVVFSRALVPLLGFFSCDHPDPGTAKVEKFLF
jgi:hypothetical protein